MLSKQAGAVEMDYISTSRPPVAKIGQNAAQCGRKRAMNTRRFYNTLRKVGLGDDECWGDVVEREGELDRVIDNAIREVSRFGFGLLLQ